MENTVLQNIYRILFLESPEAMFLFSGSKDTIQEFNEGFSKIAGYDRYESRRPELSHFIKNFGKFEELSKFIKSNDPFIYLEDVTLISRDGREFFADLQIYRFLHPEGDQFLLRILTDLEKKGSLRLKYKYLSNISHELRNPFTNISGIIEDFQKKEVLSSDTEFIKSVGLLEKNLLRVKNLLDNLLKLGSPSVENGEEVFRPEEVIGEVIEIHEKQIFDKGLKLYKNLHKGAKLSGNSFEFSQIITNLLLNSIKYTNSGTINVELKNLPGEVTVEISDSGIGIEEKYKSRIFEQFFRVPSGEVQKLSGVGIGLSIVKDLTEKMRGSILVDSIEGRGTKFTLFFPRFGENQALRRE